MARGLRRPNLAILLQNPRGFEHKGYDKSFCGHAMLLFIRIVLRLQPPADRAAVTHFRRKACAPIQWR